MILNSSNSLLLVTKIVTELQKFIHSASSLNTYRTSKRYFSRESLISFPSLICILLSNLSNSLSVELYNLLDMNTLSQFTKSAFSQKRYHISHEIFLKMNELLVEIFYGSPSSVALWKGFRLCSIDGSCLTLPKNPSTRAEFGVHLNGNRQKSGLHETIMGRLLVHFDLLNNLIVRSQLCAYTTSELSVTYQWVENLMDNSLTIFDRGFGSFVLIYLMQKYQKAFVIRLKANFSMVVIEFVKSGKMDDIVTFCSWTKYKIGDLIIPKASTLQVRLIRVVLDDGTIEVLATSLTDTQKFPVTIFKELYRLRWGVETCFDCFKNKLLALCFIGHKAEAIYQEIYATIVLNNVHQLIVKPAQEIVNQNITESTAAGIEYKHPQKINQNVTIGILRPMLFNLFYKPINEQNIQNLIQVFAQYTEPIRQKRKYKRTQSIAKRRNNFTQMNYRRAG